ncbi:MAG: site-specific integrase [Planctomycetes bacterium]|nr:site-specific integrase [Planctomycetota bacterium]
MYFVARAEADAVLAALPDAKWRLVFALARYGGLRCPSEIVRLTWADIAWDRQRFTVHASKTEHHADGGIRIVPIFPELLGYLQEAFDAAEPGEVHCCPQYPMRFAGQMYGKIVRKAIKAAGVKPWPKLFQNCRSTRETELANQFPVQVVCDWIGNSPQVAARHYLQTTEDHFTQAIRGAEEAAQKTAQQVTELVRNIENRQDGNPGSQNTSPDFASVHCKEVGATGLEPVTSTL